MRAPLVFGEILAHVAPCTGSRPHLQSSVGLPCRQVLPAPRFLGCGRAELPASSPLTAAADVSQVEVQPWRGCVPNDD